VTLRRKIRADGVIPAGPAFVSNSPLAGHAPSSGASFRFRADTVVRARSSVRETVRPALIAEPPARFCRRKGAGATLSRQGRQQVSTVASGPAASTPESSVMIVTTTPSVEGRRIVDYLGIVNGEAILGANLFKDFFASIRDLVGGRSATYEHELQKAREIALGELRSRAEELGASAVVGVDIDYEVLGAQNGMLMVAVSGTAVVIE